MTIFSYHQYIKAVKHSIRGKLEEFNIKSKYINYVVHHI